MAKAGAEIDAGSPDAGYIEGPTSGDPAGSTPMKRTFTREFKRQIASQALAGEKGMAQLCREYGLCQTLVRRAPVPHRLPGAFSARAAGPGDIPCCIDGAPSHVGAEPSVIS